MNLNHYQVFVTVAEKGNFSKAGQELFLSQPAVSQMMSQLEQELGCRLFVRQSRGVVLTVEGQEFYHQVKTGVQALEQANQRMQEMKLLEWGVLRLGVSDTISRYVLPKRLKKFSNRYPRLRISIRNGTSGELEHMLLSGEVDLVFGFMPQHLEEVEFCTLMTLHEVFVTSREYARELPELLTAQNIHQIKIMMLDRKSQTRKQIDAHLLLQNISLNPEVELANYELLAEFAKEGLGVAILARELIEDLHVLRSNIDLPTRDVGFYYQRKIPLSHAAKAFVETMIQ